MRIIDYYNFAALLINIILTGIAVYLFLRNHKCAEKAGAGTVSDPAHGSLISYDKYNLPKNISLLLLLGLGTFLRFYQIGLVPNGLQQDEASIGYEAYCLANFGTDRNGYVYPVYPITWKQRNNS